jgi:hypothetical protein
MCGVTVPIHSAYLLKPELAIKNPPNKTQKNPPKKPTSMRVFWVLLGFLKN